MDAFDSASRSTGTSERRTRYVPLRPLPSGNIAVVRRWGWVLLSLGLTLAIVACSDGGPRVIPLHTQFSSSPPTTEPARPGGGPWLEIAKGSTAVGNWTVFTTTATDDAGCFAVDTASTERLGGPSDRYQGKLPVCGYLPSRSTVIRFLNSSEVADLSSTYVTLFLLSDEVTMVRSEDPKVSITAQPEHRVVIVAGDSVAVGFHLIVTDAAQGDLRCDASPGPITNLSCSK